MGKSLTKQEKRDLFAKQIDVAEHRNLSEKGTGWLEFAKDMIEIRHTRSYTAVEIGYPTTKCKNFEQLLDNFGFAMTVEPMTEEKMDRVKKIIKVVDVAKKACQDLDSAMMYYADAKTWDLFLSFKEANWPDVIAKLTLTEWEHGDNAQEKLVASMEAMLKEHPEWKAGYRKMPNPCETIWGLAKNITMENVKAFIERVENTQEAGDALGLSLEKVDNITILAAFLNRAYGDDNDTLVVGDRDYLMKHLPGSEYDEDTNIIDVRDYDDDENDEVDTEHPAESAVRWRASYYIMIILMLFGFYGIGNVIYLILKWLSR